MSEKKMNLHQGHWVLAKLGKKVLRPGGLELTREMLSALSIGEEDDVVEFAPGLGTTGKLATSFKPHSYMAVEFNEEAAAIVEKNVAYPGMKVVVGNAAETGLANASATKVYGEAMLTMQSEAVKDKIIAEAARILRSGGLYGIHEIGLRPDDIPEAKKEEIRSALAGSIMSNVRPLTLPEWTAIMEKNGLEVAAVNTAGMFLLEPWRMIADEGILRMIKILFNMLTHPHARERVLQMRKVFRKYKNEMYAISIVARKK